MGEIIRSEIRKIYGENHGCFHYGYNRFLPTRAAICQQALAFSITELLFKFFDSEASLSLAAFDLTSNFVLRQSVGRSFASTKTQNSGVRLILCVNLPLSQRRHLPTGARLFYYGTSV